MAEIIKRVSQGVDTKQKRHCVPALGSVRRSRTVALAVTADENYVRESMLEPRAKIVRGYQPIMPIFKGSVSEEGVLQMISYIKSLTPQAGGEGNK
jgi:hypothetical protein